MNQNGRTRRFPISDSMVSNGKIWHPDLIDLAGVVGGYLPTASVTSRELGLGIEFSVSDV